MGISCVDAQYFNCIRTGVSRSGKDIFARRYRPDIARLSHNNNNIRIREGIDPAAVLRTGHFSENGIITKDLDGYRLNPKKLWDHLSTLNNEKRLDPRALLPDVRSSRTFRYKKDPVEAVFEAVTGRLLPFSSCDFISRYASPDISKTLPEEVDSALMSLFSQRPDTAKWQAVKKKLDSARIRINLIGAVLPPRLYSKEAFRGIDLSRANLCGADISNADLSGACLANSIMTNTMISNSRFDRAVLNSANLSNSDIFNSSFYGASMENVNFVNSELLSVDFDRAWLKLADFSPLRMKNCRFTEADLTGALVLTYFEVKMREAGARNLGEARLHNGHDSLQLYLPIE